MSIEEREEQTFGELYLIEIALDDDVAIPQLPFSNRVINGLMRNHITSVKALLSTRVNALEEIKQLGKKSIDEIHLFLKNYAHTDTNCRRVEETINGIPRNPIVMQYREKILLGQDEFLCELSEADKADVCRYLEARAIIGDDIATKCIKEPDEAIEIFKVINEIRYVLEKQVEIDKKIKELFVW